MYKVSGNKAVSLREMFVGLLRKNLPTAFADEGDGSGTGGDTGAGAGGTGTDPTQTQPPQINYEDLISRARKEEKDKLYPEIEKYKKQYKEMEKSNNKNLLRIGELETELESIKNGGESAEVTSLKSRVAELESELETAKKDRPDEEAIRAEIEKKFEVKLYRTERLASDEVKNAVLPMFLEGITGETNEEIDASIQNAMELTKKAKEQAGVKPDDGNGGGDGTGTGNNNGAGNGTSNNTGNGAGTGSQTPPAPNPSGVREKVGAQSSQEFIASLDLNNPADVKKYEEWRAQNGLR